MHQQVEVADLLAARQGIAPAARRDARLELGDLLVALPQLGRLLGHTGRDLEGARTEALGGLSELVLEPAHVGERTVPGHRLETPHPLGHAGLLDDLDEPDVSRAGRVRATAELLRLAHGEHADGVAILLAEEGDGAPLFGDGDGQDLGLDRHVAQHARVGQVLDALALGRRHGREVGEVEAQALGGHERALLGDVRAQDLTQRPVEEVGRRVVPADGVAALGIDGQLEALADAQLALANLAEVYVQAR